MEATPPRRQQKKMTETTLKDENVIALGATVVKEETKKAVNAGSGREDRLQTFVESFHRTVARSASSKNRPPTYISYERTDKKTYSKIKEEKDPDLPPLKDVTVGNKSRLCETNPDRELDVSGLTVIESVNIGYATAVHYR